MQLYASFSDNYVWLIRYSKDDPRVIVVDPGEAEPVVKRLNDLSLVPVAILITHGCHDHVDGIADLLSWYELPVYGSIVENIYGLTDPVSESDVIRFFDDSYSFKVIEAPGHTAGHVMYYGQGELYCGDTLFGAGCGKVSAGLIDMMYDSIQKIAALPDSTAIYCSHEYTLRNLNFAAKIEPYNAAIKSRAQQAYQLQVEGRPTIPTTLYLEKATNPFLRCHVPEVIAAAESFAGRSLATTREVFATLRLWKDMQ